MVVTHVVSCGHVWPESLGRKMSLTFECVYLNMCCVLAALRRRGGGGVGRRRVWRDASVGARVGAWRECVPFCDNLSL